MKTRRTIRTLSLKLILFLLIYAAVAEAADERSQLFSYVQEAMSCQKDRLRLKDGNIGPRLVQRVSLRRCELSITVEQKWRERLGLSQIERRSRSRLVIPLGAVGDLQESRWYYNGIEFLARPGTAFKLNGTRTAIAHAHVREDLEPRDLANLFRELERLAAICSQE